MALFSEDATVHSPTAGVKSARDFFAPLLERSTGTTFSVRDVFSGEDKSKFAVLFDYKKTLPDGKTKIFPCVDIFTFDADGKITELKIIFDTKNLG